jgi:hypothetical protein
MKRLMMLTLVCLAAFSLVSAARASDNKCKDVTGHDVVTQIPAPNDPLGRALGQSIGDLKAAISTVLTSFNSEPDGSSIATSLDVWVLSPQDTLIFNGNVALGPVSSAGTASGSATLTVTGGTGEFAGASGVVNLTVTGFNLAGSAYFDETYRGKICLAN